MKTTSRRTAQYAKQLLNYQKSRHKQEPIKTQRMLLNNFFKQPIEDEIFAHLQRPTFSLSCTLQQWSRCPFLIHLASSGCTLVKHLADAGIRFGALVRMFCSHGVK